MGEIKNPLSVLKKALNEYVVVKLKSGMELRGYMVDCDDYMNIILKDAVEYEGDQAKANYGNIFIRGNNILYVKFPER